MPSIVSSSNVKGNNRELEISKQGQDLNAIYMELGMAN